MSSFGEGFRLGQRAELRRLLELLYQIEQAHRRAAIADPDGRSLHLGAALACDGIAAALSRRFNA